MTDPCIEAQLLARVARGDVDAFSDLYDRLANTLFSVAVRILGDTGTAEDVLQEVFVQIFDKASAYDPRLGKPLTWAITLTRNRAIDHLRVEQRGQRVFAEWPKETNGAEAEAARADDALIGSERARDVRTALQALAPEQRQAIEMAFFRGLSQTEIATELNTPLGTVKARIRRGMLRLREALAHQ